jgi:hypothetical protein
MEQKNLLKKEKVEEIQYIPRRDKSLSIIGV